MKKKRQETSRSSADSGASVRRSKRGKTRPAKALATTEQPKTKRAGRKKPTLRSGVNPKKSSSGSRAPVARVSFQSTPTLSTRVLKKVVGDLLRDELKNHAQWLLQHTQILIERFLGHATETSSDSHGPQTEGASRKSTLGRPELDGDANAVRGDVTGVKTIRAESGSAAQLLPVDVPQLANEVRNLATELFRAYEPLEYLLLAYAKRARVGTDTPFFQTDTGWKSARSRKKACEELMKRKLIIGFGHRIEIDPELVTTGKRKADHRFQGHQITELGISVLNVLIPWLDELIVDLPRKTRPVAPQ